MKKFLNCAFLAGLLALLAAVPVGVLLWGQKETTAYYENRNLAVRPDLNFETLWDGSYGSRLESWFSDHTPGRTTALRLDTVLQMDILKRPVVNGIVMEADGVLLPELEFGEWTRADYEETVVPLAENYGKLNAHIEETGGKFYFIGFPEQRIYFEDKFPAYMNNHADEAAAADDVFAEALEEKGIRFLDMRAAYEELGDPAEYYSVVDHHYNYYGAYAAYLTIMDSLAADGWDLPVLTDAEFREVPNPYIGSRNRKLYNLWEHEEKVAVLAETPVPFTRTDNGAPSEKPLFVLPELDYMPTTCTWAATLRRLFWKPTDPTCRTC